MLHVPVALITEKLRGQSLEDEHLKVPREGTLQIEGKNVWLACDGGECKDQEGNNTGRGDRGPGSTGPSSSSLSFLPPLNDNDSLVLGATRRISPPGGVPLTPSSFSSGVGGGSHRFLVKPAARVRCGHVGDQGGVVRPPVVDYAGLRAFDTPPKKKHCRSLSVPADAPPQGPGVGGAGAVASSTSPQVEGAKVWRPIPITALTAAGVAASSSGGAGVGGGAGRSGTPTSSDGRTLTLSAPFVPPHPHHSHHHHHHHHQHHPHQYHHPHYHTHHDGSRTLSSFTAIGSTAARFHRDFKGTGGVGGGVLGSGGGGGGGLSGGNCCSSPLSVDSGRETTSDLHTPPQSPVPRPSSATSVRSAYSAAFLTASSSSSASSSSWWGHPPGRSRGEHALQSRSLSCEEQMSCPSMGGVGGVGGDLQHASSASGSTPCVLGSAWGTGSLPLSPCRGGKIPRCHSQPCVLHHRRCGKKRRRDDRPTLDFHKMTETAYQGKPMPSGTPAQDIQKVRWRSDMDYMCVGGLMPIASSPRDSDLPATPRAADHAALSAITDLDLDIDLAASTDLPATPPASDISSGIDIREPVKLIGEEEEEEEDGEEEGEGGSNCGCHRDLSRDEGAGMFPLTDLDLEQIENH